MHAHRYVLKGIVQVKRRMSHLTKRVQSINRLIKSVNDIYRRGRYQMFEYCTNGSPPPMPLQAVGPCSPTMLVMLLQPPEMEPGYNLTKKKHTFLS